MSVTFEGFGAPVPETASATGAGHPSNRPDRPGPTGVGRAAAVGRGARPRGPVRHSATGRIPRLYLAMTMPPGDGFRRRSSRFRVVTPESRTPRFRPAGRNKEMWWSNRGFRREARRRRSGRTMGVGMTEDVILILWVPTAPYGSADGRERAAPGPSDASELPVPECDSGPPDPATGARRPRIGGRLRGGVGVTSGGAPAYRSQLAKRHSFVSSGAINPVPPYT